jgi:hypothetical protein
MLWVVLRTTISGWTNERTNAAGPGAVVQSCEVKDSTSRRRRPGAALLLVATRARVRSITSTNRLHLGEAAARQGAATAKGPRRLLPVYAEEQREHAGRLSQPSDSPSRKEGGWVLERDARPLRLY